jgi:DNA-binding PadR family transcriptional regulator
VTVDRRPETMLPLTPAMFHVLICLAEGPRHGYRILKDVAERTNGRIELSTGTLYGIIKRLLDDGLAVEVASGHERRREYRLTGLGRLVARAEAKRLEDLVASARLARLLPALREGDAS